MTDSPPHIRLVEELRTRQCQLWQGGNRVLVESLLREYPFLAADSEGTLHLVYQEILLRERHGEKPKLDEYVRRFPQHAERLERLFEVHHAFESREILAFHNPELAETPTAVWNPPPDPAGPPTVPGYEIFEELGQGGAGIVYRARQSGLNRIVALKMLRSGIHASPEELRRFRSEAEAQARLQHPHIVQIHEVKECSTESGTGVVHFLAMEYLDGGSLERFLAGKPQPSRLAAEFVETLARAVHHAHEHGLVHRDLKPGNILLQGKAQGARTKSQSGSKDQLRTPERNARKSAPGGGSRLPSVGDAEPGILEFTPKVADFGLAKHLQENGVSSASGNVVGTPSYMAPEQAAGDSHAIGPPTDVYALGAILYTMLTGRPPFLGDSLLGTLMQVKHDEPVSVRRLQPRVPRDLETICLKCLQKDPRRRYSSAEALADDLRRFREGQPIVARPISSAERLARWSRRNPWPAAAAGIVLLTVATAFVLVTAAWREERASAMREGHERQRAELEQKLAETRSAYLTFQQALTLCDQGEIGRGMFELARALELAIAVEDAALERIVRLNLDGWNRHVHPLQGIVKHAAGVMCVAYSPDGKLIAIGGRGSNIQLREATLSRSAKTLPTHGPVVQVIAFSPDGKRLAAGFADGKVRFWDLPEGNPVGQELEHRAVVQSLSFSTDSKLLATGCGDGKARIWNLANGEADPPFDHGGAFVAVALHPEKPLLATAGRNYKAHLWDLKTREQLKPALDHPQAVNSLAFHPNGRTLMTGCHDGVVRFWNVESRAKLDLELAHRQIVQTVAYSRDGKRIVAGCYDSTARIWDARTGVPLGNPLPHESIVLTVAFHPDGNHVVTGCQDGPARLWQVSGKTTGDIVLENGDMISAVAFCADGKRLAVACRPPKLGVLVYDLIKEQAIGRAYSAEPFRIQALAFSPDGQWLVGGGIGGNIAWWDKKLALQSTLVMEGHIKAHTFTPDSTTFLAAGLGRTVRGWNPADSKPTGPALSLPDVIQALAVSPTGTILMGGGRSARGEVRFGNLTKAQEEREPLAHPSMVVSLEFSRDGKTLLSGCQRGTVHLWDATTYQPLRKPLQETGMVRCAAISPNGKMILTDIHSASARLWDAATGLPLGPALRHWKWVLHVAFSPDGQRMLTAGQDGIARLWSIPVPRPGSAADVRKQLQVSTGLELDEDGGVRFLAPEVWHERAKQLRN